MMVTHEIVQLSSFSSSKFIWKIKNISELNYKGLKSEVFCVGSSKWQAGFYPNSWLDDVSQFCLFPVRLTKSVNTEFSFSVTSQTECKTTVRCEGTQKFTGCSPVWISFMPLNEFHDPSKGYIVNDTCVFTIEVSVDDYDDGVEKSNPDKNAKTGREDKKTSRTHTGAGQHFDKGQHNCKVGFGEDKEFVDVGGFSIWKIQAPLYKQIWLKYGHIPSTKVMPISSYHILVLVVKDLMTSIIAMHQCRYVELSPEKIEGWEEMLSMSEKFEFNVGWLRKRFDCVKKGLGGMQKVKTELLEHGHPLRAAKSRVKAAEDELKKAEAQLIAAKDYLRENVSGVLSQSDMEMYLDIGENLLLDGLF